MNRLIGLTWALGVGVPAAALWAQVCPALAPCDVSMPGDYDGDGDIDAADAALLGACSAGPDIPLAPGCGWADLDGDGDGDQNDFGIWQRLSTGSCDCGPLIAEPPGSQPGNPLRSTYLFSGEFYEAAVDLHIRGRGVDFVWGRKYRSRIGPTTELGSGWDHSYNIRIEAAGEHLRLYDGNTRADVYRRQADGTWTRPEFFNVLSKNPDESYTLTFDDTHRRYVLHSLDGSPMEGKIASSVDRNGNAMTFEYDAAGRLSVIHDSLDTASHNRDITIAYNPDGRIASVTDFIGRQVTYTYYDGVEPGGNAGDLKSVTTPAVTGTPHGNDFPAGKTTTYTYSTGFADERLNHNLLTITDDKGQTYLENVYSQATDPSDRAFDRLIQQVWAGPDEDLPTETDSIIYVIDLPQTPGPGNNNAVSVAIVNDRVGNVEEHYFDERHRCVLIREYTGRADPDLPTTETANRPQNPLRPGDPAFYETRYAYNDDSLPTSIVDANGNEAQFTYDSANPDPRSRGNLLEHCVVPGPLGGDQSQICEAFEYNPAINFGTNFVTRHIDGRGNQTTFAYDTRGNRTQTTHRIGSIVEDFEYNAAGQLTAAVHPDNGSGHRRRDEFTYYTSGPSMGYLHQTIVDAGAGLSNLTTTCEYDTVGNITRVIDPRGSDALFTYNQLDQLVRTQSRPLVLPGGPVRHESLYHYDANDNLVRMDVENRGADGTPGLNTHFTTTYEYEILDRLVRVVQEVGPGQEIVVEYEYDASRNLTLVRDGEATNGNQPDNVVQYVYDERDLLFREVRAPGSADQSTTQYSYDGNRQFVLVVSGFEDAAAPHVRTYEYDGFDRLTAGSDAMGNVTTYHYDANGNTVSPRVDGELNDVPGSVGNKRLYESTNTYDALDRLITCESADFDPVFELAFGDGLMTTQYTYNDNSQVLSVTDDNSHTTSYAYDTANRRSIVSDAMGNTTTYAYDANSNVVSVTQVDKSDLPVPDETFLTTNTYDALDRRTTSTDSSGNTTTYGYDSRDNLEVTADALGSETRYSYDGLNRLVLTIMDLDGDGADGDGPDITTGQLWDDSSRLVLQSDDKGNATIYVYDALDRLVSPHFADGTSETYTYDVHLGRIEPQEKIDVNGSIVTSTQDLLDRLTGKAIVVAPGVSADTTFETLAYDGLGRLAESQDDDAIVTFTWTSLGRITQQTLNGQATSATYDNLGNLLTCTYPGGRQITYTYDALDRTSTIGDATGPLATRSYVGQRLTRQQLGNGVTTDFAYDGLQGVPNPPGDHGVKRVIGTTHGGAAGPIDARTYTWDPVYRKTQRADIRAGGPELVHLYDYDKHHRLIRGRKTDSFSAVRRDTNYVLDGVGNRVAIFDPLGPGGNYVMDPTLPEPADEQMNQYTQTPDDFRQYDRNGNLVLVGTALGGRTVEYDYADRIVSVADNSTGQTATYRYDALGRRIAKVTHTMGLPTPPVETRYFYGHHQNAWFDALNVVEEQDDTGTTLATYAHTEGVDEILSADRAVQRYFYHRDDLGNVMAVSDGTGAVVERYEYDDYGAPQFFSGADVPQAGSAIGNPYLFTSREYDPETGWYYYRARYLDPEAGRFVSRDPIGIWGDSGSIGNAYTYAGNNPWTWTDPTGEAYTVCKCRSGDKTWTTKCPDKYDCTMCCDYRYDTSEIGPSGGGGGGGGSGGGGAWNWLPDSTIAMDTWRPPKPGAGGGGGGKSAEREYEYRHMEEVHFVYKEIGGGGAGGIPFECVEIAHEGLDSPTLEFTSGDPYRAAIHPLTQGESVTDTTWVIIIDTTEYQEGGTLMPRKGPGTPGGGGGIATFDSVARRYVLRSGAPLRIGGRGTVATGRIETRP